MNLKDIKAFFASDKPADVQLLERAEAIQEENATLAAEVEKLRANAQQLTEAQARISALEQELATAQAATQAAQARAEELAQQDAAPRTEEAAAGLATEVTANEFAKQPWNTNVLEYLG